jgi:formamidopyrimidine-DNA glycosylase
MLSRVEAAHLERAVRAVLAQAIRAGGTTLRDYVGADGVPGYFRQRLYVYERAGKPCRRCGTPVRSRTQGQRSTYYCPACQK